MQSEGYLEIKPLNKQSGQRDISRQKFTQQILAYIELNCAERSQSLAMNGLHQVDKKQEQKAHHGMRGNTIMMMILGYSFATYL